MKLINRVKVLDRLRARFQTEDMVTEPFVLSETVIPTTNVDSLVVQGKTQQIGGVATNRSDAYIVPAGKRWTVFAGANVRAQTGVCTISVIIDGIEGYLARGASALHFFWDGKVILEEGDTFRIYSATGTSGDIISSIVYQEEDAY